MVLCVCARVNFGRKVLFDNEELYLRELLQSSEGEKLIPVAIQGNNQKVIGRIRAGLLDPSEINAAIGAIEEQIALLMSDPEAMLSTTTSAITVGNKKFVLKTFHSREAVEAVSRKVIAGRDSNPFFIVRDDTSPLDGYALAKFCGMYNERSVMALIIHSGKKLIIPLNPKLMELLPAEKEDPDLKLYYPVCPHCNKIVEVDKERYAIIGNAPCTRVYHDDCARDVALSILCDKNLAEVVDPEDAE